MAIQKGIAISITYIGDGTSTVFTLDLHRDPYFIGAAADPEVVNWFSSALRTKNPIGVLSISGEPVTFSAGVLTFTVPVAPRVNDTAVASVYILFD